jgi:Zn finger protein HypA/HybF involved in hydrogenase expression
MVAVAFKSLPQDKALNVRLGAGLLVLGLLIVFYSFSGNQAYDLTFFYLAIGGTILAVYGTVLLANSRVVNERRRRVHAKSAAGAEVREWIRLQCPQCSTVFEEEGARPFTAICPNCKSSGRIE